MAPAGAFGVERGLQPDIELAQQPQEFLDLLAREIREREIQFLDHQRNQVLDGLAAGLGDLQLDLAAIAVPAYALEQAPLRKLVDDPGERSAVVAELRADVLRVDRDPVPSQERITYWM